MGAKQRWLMTALAIIITWSWHASVAEGATSTAKEGCQQHCGNIEIPYPFGIGEANCFHNEWFEVVCASDTTPYLKKLTLEVAGIGMRKYAKEDSGWFLNVNNPIMASPPICAAGTNKATAATPLDFTGSPFHFSAVYNRLAGSGCTSQISLIDGKGRRVPNAGCASTCLDDANGQCCKTTIPEGMQMFNVLFSSTVPDDYIGCTYAMLGVTEQWLSASPGTACSTAMKSSDTVPAFLEWGLKSSTDEAKALLERSQARGDTIGVLTKNYYDGSDIQFAYCLDGFQGSAYVPNGCQDIDECKLSPSPCSKDETCENTTGGHKCVNKLYRIAIIVGSSIAALLVVILAILGGFMIRNKLQKKKFFIINGGLTLNSVEHAGKIKIFKEHELKKATNNFREGNKIGKGGQGTVYKGTLQSGTLVAVKQCKKTERSKVKKPDNDSIEAGEEAQGGAFIREVILLSKTDHVNIVSFLGCCLETEAPMLVFECLANGDLSHHLQKDVKKEADGADRSFELSWHVRLNIAAQIADGLSYLHLRTRGGGIYHRDVKTENILLDNNFTAKLADFGISQSVSENDESGLVHGSCGYKDPEYMSSSQYTAKSDVYSFGVVLAELLTGKKPVYTYITPETLEANNIILADYFKELETAKIRSTFLDARVKYQGTEKEVEAVINVAKRCLEKEGKDRPTMNDVAMELEKIRSEHTANVNAVEMEEHVYYESQDITSPLGGTPTRPLRRLGSQSSTDDDYTSTV